MSEVRALRFLGTAFSFAVFGIFGMLLGGIVFPLLRLLPLPASCRLRVGRKIVVTCFNSFFRMMHRVGVLTYDIQGRERLGRPGQLILANHPSLIDVVFLIGCTPNAGCVVKSELWRNPFMAGVIANTGYVPNAPTHEMLERAEAELRDGRSLIMFPEGTRTRPDKPLEFHRGAAAVAIRAASVVTPVLITVTPPTLSKHEKWYQIPLRRPHFSFIVGDDIDIEFFRASGAPPAAARALNACLLEIFQKSLNLSDSMRQGAWNSGSISPR